MHIPAHVLPALAWASMVIFVLAIPLILGKVPRNPWYGIRTSAAMQGTDTDWYAINRTGGLILAACSAVVLIAIALLVFLR